MKNGLSYLVALLFALVGFAASANALVLPEKMDSTVIDRFSIYYKCDSVDVNPTYLDNPSQISRILNYINNSPRIDSIVINAYASPEGGYNYNKRLSIERAETAKRLLLSYSRDSIRLNPSKIVIRQCGENWGGLTNSLLESYNKEDREEVLSILLDTTISDATRKTRLMAIDSGRTWRYIIDNYMSVLRNAEWIFYCAEVREISKLPEIKGILRAQEKPLAGKTEVYHPEVEEKSFYMDVSSNLLYDAAAIPNVGAEFYLGKGFSLKADWSYAWWKNDPAHWYWRTYGGDLGLRYWFGNAAKEKPLTGHHIGVYGQILTYDFELGKMGIMGGKPGGVLKDQPNYTVALEYGYSLPIAKRLNLDFSVGVGYHWGIFHEYVPMDDCYVWQATKKRNYVGPVKADISLVWLIGKGNSNTSRKGGRR